MSIIKELALSNWSSWNWWLLWIGISNKKIKGHKELKKKKDKVNCLNCKQIAKINKNNYAGKVFAFCLYTRQPERDFRGKGFYNGRLRWRKPWLLSNIRKYLWLSHFRKNSLYHQHLSIQECPAAVILVRNRIKEIGFWKFVKKISRIIKDTSIWPFPSKAKPFARTTQ
jgi:hypothetical protein